MISHSNTYITEKHLNVVRKCMVSKRLTKGDLNFDFSNQLKDFLDLNYVTLTSSGTNAFYKILLAIDLEPDDEVLIPNYICNSLLGPIKQLSATPILYDNQKDNWLSNIEEILKVVSPKTKVILINHTFGFVNTIVRELKNKIPNQVKIIEDCCHIITPKSKIGNHTLSKDSFCSFYSFNATKLIATGEGGAIATNCSSFYDKIKSIEMGSNLSDFNCSLGISQLNDLNKFLRIRKEIAYDYIKELSPYVEKIGSIDSGVFYRFPIITYCNKKFLEDKKVSYRLGVDQLLDKQLNVPKLTNSNKLLKKLVSIPIYPGLTRSQIRLVIENTKKLILNGN